MWRDYLLRSQIVGIDINEKHCPNLGRRVRLMRADQSDPCQLSAIVESIGQPDIVIDDGSHVGDHILTTFSALFPRLNPGGIYVVEDLCTSFIAAYGGAIPPGERTAIGLVQCLVESAQSLDVSFDSFFRVPAPVATFDDVSAVHVYPGIAFVEKAASGDREGRVARPMGAWHQRSETAHRFG